MMASFLLFSFLSGIWGNAIFSCFFGLPGHSLLICGFWEIKALAGLQRLLVLLVLVFFVLVLLMFFFFFIKKSYELKSHSLCVMIFGMLAIFFYLFLDVYEYRVLNAVWNSSWLLYFLLLESLMIFFISAFKSLLMVIRVWLYLRLLEVFLILCI